MCDRQAPGSLVKQVIKLERRLLCRISTKFAREVAHGTICQTVLLPEVSPSEDIQTIQAEMGGSGYRKS